MPMSTQPRPQPQANGTAARRVRKGRMTNTATVYCSAPERRPEKMGLGVWGSRVGVSVAEMEGPHISGRDAAWLRLPTVTYP
jgi:hypothetical protein